MPAEKDEIQAIVGIHGEVDRAVARDPAARERVALLLLPYQEHGLSWYDEFLKWLGEPPGADGDQRFYPDITEALQRLQEPGVARPRMRARRMFAIALASRAFAEQMKEEGGQLRDLAMGAISAISDEARGEDQSGVLYRALAGETPKFTDPVPGSAAWWKQMVETAQETRVIKDTVGMYPKPCVGTLVKAPGREGPVDALRTEFENDEVPFARATNFLEPSNWAICRPDFWCEMKQGAQLDGGQRLYHEVVSTHCEDKGKRGFWAETDLLFNFMWIPEEGKGAEAAVANYQLAREPQKNDRILVDEGTLVVATKPKSKTLLITTTKRVRFSHGFPPGALALMMCPLGYAEVGADLMACAAVKGGPLKGTPFPGVPVDAPGAGAPRAHAGRAAGGGSGPGSVGGVAEEMCEIWADAMREGAKAFGRLAGAGQGVGRGGPKGPGS